MIRWNHIGYAKKIGVNMSGGDCPKTNKLMNKTNR